MNNLIRLPAVLVLVAISALGIRANAQAQAPTPIVVQAATSTAAATSASRATTPGADLQSLAAAIKALEEIRAANEDVLAKQKAALEKLDELHDAAEQLQIFAKRG
jgi:prophage DNA circulation protein